MRVEQIEEFKAVLSEQQDGLDAMRAALLLTVRLLIDPRSYDKPVNRPHSALRSFVHWLLLGYRPVASAFGRDGVWPLQRPGGSPVNIRRTLHREEGKHIVLVGDEVGDELLLGEKAKFDFDLCISFAGEERWIAEAIANAIKERWSGAKIFYDEFEKWSLWGGDLVSSLYNVYSVRSRRCLVLISPAYLQKAWPRHELRAAYARMVKEGVGYIMPILIDGAATPRELETVSYLSLAHTTTEEIGNQLGETVFREGYQDWLTADDLTELLSEEFRFSVSVGEFQKAIEADSNEEEAIAKAILALLWACEGTRREVRVFFEYLAFEFPSLAQLFNAKEQYLAIPPDGRVRRWLGNGGPIVMMPAFWQPIFEEAKAGNPLFEPSEGESRSELG